VSVGDNITVHFDLALEGRDEIGENIAYRQRTVIDSVGPMITILQFEDRADDTRFVIDANNDVWISDRNGGYLYGVNATIEASPDN
jgi:hypothetical protein